MDTPTPQPVQPQQQYTPPQQPMSPQPHSSIPTGQVLIALALLLVGGGVVWALTRSSGEPTATETPDGINININELPSTGGSTSGSNQPSGGSSSGGSAPTQAPSNNSPFTGRYTGRFTGGGVNCSSGSLVMNVAGNGAMTGAATIDYVGVTLTGGGSVDGNGNLSGGWSFADKHFNLSGKFLSNGTGSGTYTTGDCVGTFSVQR